MLLVRSLFEVADNTGATFAECIRVLKKKKEHACVNDIIIVAIKNAKKNKKIKKGEVRVAVIIRQKKEINRKNGYSIAFKKNAIILVNTQYNPIGTRIKGPVLQELRKSKRMKVLALATIII